jgi:putative phosphoesterase
VAEVKVGVISDTHGNLPDEVFDAFDGVDHILHAGDIGGVDLLTELQSLAIVTAVVGNTDGFEVRQQCPEVAELTLEGHTIVVVHGDRFGVPTPERLRGAYPQAQIIAYGHTHQALVETIGDVSVINPGSASAPKTGTRPSVGLITLARGRDPQLQLIQLSGRM